MKVQYDGSSDFREFSAADFTKAGVEAKKISFAKGEAVEVSEEVGAALTSKEGIFGEEVFSEVREDEELPLEEPQPEKPKRK